MKKAIKGLLSAAIGLVLVFSSAACTPSQEEHKHEFSLEWKTDAEYHWHEAICEHKGEISGKARHQFLNDTCFICGYQKEQTHTHTFGAWQNIEGQEPTCTQPGMRERICSVCGTAEQDVAPALGHDYQEEVLVEGDCLTNGRSKITCSRCDYEDYRDYPAIGEHSWIEGWQSNAVEHWHECGACGAKKDVTPHSGGLSCTECGYSLLETSGLKIEVNDDGTTCKVTGFGSVKSDSIVIPRTYTFPNTNRALPVTTIAPYAFMNREMGSGRDVLTSVIMFDNIKTIGAYAFFGCQKLKYISFTDSVTEIGENAFGDTAFLSDEESLDGGGRYVAHCLVAADPGSVGTFTVRDGTLRIAEGAFAGCDGITELALPSSILSSGLPDGVFDDCTSLEAFETTADGAFFARDGVLYSRIAIACVPLCIKGEITLQSNIFIIPDNAFSGRSGLERVSLADQVKFTSVGNNAFKDCTSLEAIDLPDTLTRIGERAFENCTSLTQIDIPDLVSEIGKSAFFQCSRLSVVTLGSGLGTIGDYAFLSTAIAQLTIPASVTHIGFFAFEGCDRLLSVHFENTDNWTVTQDGSGEGGTPLSSGDLGNEETAAYYLTDEYKAKIWLRGSETPHSAA